MKDNQSGQSLFEVLVALAISTIIVISLISLVSNSIRNTTFSRNKTLAARYAQEATEWLRGQRDEDMETFKTNTLTIIWCLSDLAWNTPGSCADDNTIEDTNFIREVTFNSSLLGGKSIIQADVLVTWDDSQGVHEVRSSTNFSDWRER